MVQSAWTYLRNNFMGNWNAGTANVLPAVLTTWSNLLANRGNKTQYELYKEQANSYVDTARENAKLIKSQGEIALRNLSYKHSLERGNDVVRVAASGTGMGGSNLDVIVRKEKIRKMNEATVRANYTNQAMMEMVNGFRQAGNVYGTLAQKAEGDKWASIASILKGVEVYAALSARDAKIESDVREGHQRVKNYETEAYDQQNQYYRPDKLKSRNNKGTVTATDLGFSTTVNTTGTTLLFDSTNNVTNPNGLGEPIINT